MEKNVESIKNLEIEAKVAIPDAATANAICIGTMNINEVPMDSEQHNVNENGSGSGGEDNGLNGARGDAGIKRTFGATFDATIIRQTVSSVTINWNLIEHAEVYKIEKYHRRRGWEKVAWTSHSPVTIENLAENFGYRFRIKALAVATDGSRYVALQISPDIIGVTEAALPTTVCLQRAIKKGQQFLVKRILRRRPSLIEYPGPNGYLPLANAIIHSEMCIIDMLLTEGANVHIGNPRNGRTPLHLAFYHGRLSAARILLNKKAKLEAVDCNGMTAAHHTVDANQYEMLKLALESGANLEARDAGGWTVLMRAVIMNGDVQLLKLLVMHGADLAAVDSLQQNCVDLARLYQRTEVANYFEKVIKYREMQAANTAATATHTAVNLAATTATTNVTSATTAAVNAATAAVTSADTAATAASSSAV